MHEINLAQEQRLESQDAALGSIRREMEGYKQLNVRLRETLKKEKEDL